MKDSRPRWRAIVAILLLWDVPFWRRSLPRRLARVGVFGCYLYAAALLALVALEDRILFPGATFARSPRLPPEARDVLEVTIPSADGQSIHAWFVAPAGWTPAAGAVLYSHGNGSDLSRTSGRGTRWRDPFGRAVMLYDYPGFGRSTGRPSEAGCYAAGEAALLWLVQEQRVPVGEVILVGESLGGAVATELATRHEVRMLVLHGAFTSVPDMAQTRFPIFPARYLARNRMDNEANIGRARCPVLISHGTADGVVPFAQGERLYAAAREPKRFVPIEGGGHGSPDKGAYFAEVRAFLAETAR
jgi:fermentation-respiration switch protein FrsA (DUF1100 family)